MHKKLPLDFYLQDTIEVARQLLGKRLTHILSNGHVRSGIITETEAYLGIEDPAAHSYGDRHTKRTEVMYAQGGITYMFLIYGMHYCFNVVTQEEGTPEAVLVRGILCDENTPYKKTNGPGKFSRHLGLNKSHNGVSLDSKSLFLSEAAKIEDKKNQSHPSHWH